MSAITVPTLKSPRSRARVSPFTHLGSYRDVKGAREILSFALCDDSVLVIDTPSGGLPGALLLAHLTPDEPAENPSVLCGIYLADKEKGHCRPLTPQDLKTNTDSHRASAVRVQWREVLTDAEGRRYRLSHIKGRTTVPELYWTSCSPEDPERLEPVALRDVVAALEAYEPARAMTVAALADTEAEEVSTAKLRASLTRVIESPILLNRGLREAVQRAASHGTTLSEIAQRCGRTKTDQKGNISGETSWLERRIGLRPESSCREPKRWVHSEVLALIARDGLGIAPCEVEL